MVRKYMEDYMISVDNAYQFFLMPKTVPNIQRDAKIQQTVTAIIEEFFRSNDVLLDYICDTKDGRQAARSRLFEQWFNHYPQRHLYTPASPHKTRFDTPRYRIIWLAVRNNMADGAK